MSFIRVIIISVVSFAVLACSDENNVPNLPEPNPGGGTVVPSSALVVMSYNTRHCAPYYGTSETTKADERTIASIIKSKNPDVVCLQEIDSCNNRTDFVDQTKVIADYAGYPHFTFFNIMEYRGGKYGMAMLSKYPLLDKAIIAFPSEYNGVQITNHTTAGSASIMIDGQRIFVVCVHLSVYESQRNAQLSFIYDSVLSKRNDPTLVCGDFNGTRNSSTFNLMTQYGLIPTNVNPENYTIPSTSPNREIDYITYSPADRWAVKSHMVVTGTNASDHLPIVSVLKLN